MREEALALVGGVVARRGPRARPAPSRRSHHATPAAWDLSQAARAAARSVAVQRGGRGRVLEDKARRAAAAWHRGLDRYERRHAPMASARSSSGDGWRLLG